MAPPHAARYLADAFADYPLVKWVLQNEPDEAMARAALFEALVNAYQVLGSTFEWIPDNGPVAIWADITFPARRPIRQRPDLRKIFFFGLSKQIIRRLIEIEIESEKNCPHSEEFRMLQLVGVRKQDRRFGFGKLLIIKMGSGTHLPIFAETSDPKNLRFYMSLSFDSYCEYKVGWGGPKVWVLIRPAGVQS